MKTSKEYAEMFNTTAPNLRKWCMALEKEGYRFLKDKKSKNDVRVFQDYYDKPVLEYLKSLLNENISLEMAAKMAIERHGYGYEPGNENLEILPKNDSRTDVVPMSEIEALRAENQEMKSILTALIGEFADVKQLISNQSKANQFLLESHSKVAVTKEEFTNQLDQLKQEMVQQTNQVKEEVIETITKSRSETHSKKSLWDTLFNRK